MNDTLSDVFQQLRLEPGTYRCVLPAQEIVIQVLPRKESDGAPTSERPSHREAAESAIVDESCIVLDPWVELPRPKPIGRVVGRLAPPPPPDIPDIPVEDEMP